jgi:hypothetical protein
MSLPTLNTTVARRPRRRWLRRFVVGGGILISLVAIGHWVESWREERDWREACAEADRLDPGWRWNDLVAARPNPPDDQNVAVRVRAVQRLLPPNWSDDPLVERLGTLARNQRPHPDQVGAIRRTLAPAAAALAATDGLDRLMSGGLPREYRSPIESTLFPEMTADIQDTRQVARLLNLHAQLLVEDGRADNALTAVRQLLADARAAASEPTLINALVCSAIRAIAVNSLERVLAQGEPTPEALAVTQRALEVEAERPLMLEALRGERAMIEDFARAVVENRVTQDQLNQFDGYPARLTGVATIDEWIHRVRGGFRLWKATGFVRYYTALIEIANESPDALDLRHDEVAAIEARTSSTVRDSIPTAKMREADRRLRAQLRIGYVSVAAERFRRDKGRWPTSLAELVPVYLKAVPLDPSDGQPLRFAKHADGIMIYSVGWGAGLKLFDPEHRRQPPPIKPPEP